MRVFSLIFFKNFFSLTSGFYPPAYRPALVEGRRNFRTFLFRLYHPSLITSTLADVGAQLMFRAGKVLHSIMK